MLLQAQQTLSSLCVLCSHLDVILEVPGGKHQKAGYQAMDYPSANLHSSRRVFRKYCPKTIVYVPERRFFKKIIPKPFFNVSPLITTNAYNAIFGKVIPETQIYVSERHILWTLI